MAKTKSGRDVYTGTGGGDQGAAWWKDSHELYLNADGTISKAYNSNEVNSSANTGRSIGSLFGTGGKLIGTIAGAAIGAARSADKDKASKQIPLSIPAEKLTSLEEDEIIDALNYYIQNKEKVIKGELTQSAFEQGLLDKMGSHVNAKGKLDYIDTIIDMNATNLGFDSGWNADQYTPEVDENGNPTGRYIQQTTQTSDADLGGSGIDYYQDLIDKNLMTDPNSERAQQYRQNMYSSINAYEQASNASLASAELDAYRMLGQQQLQLESEIANQRMQALKSGTTSAQLASQQLANMFAAQSAAQQTAAAVMQQRASMADQYNQQRASVESDLYNLTNNNALTAANAYAQLGAAQANYNSYIQQPFAQYMAAVQTQRKYPDSFEAINTSISKSA